MSVPETMTGTMMAKGKASTNAEQFTRMRTHFDSHETLPKRLSELGYTTIGFVTNPWLTSRSGIDESFDEFRGLGVVDEESFFRRISLAAFDETLVGDLALWFDRWRYRRGFFSQWETYIDELLARIQQTESPYYLWVFLMEPHNPYIVPRRDRSENSTLGMYYGLLRGNDMFQRTDTDATMKADLPRHVETRVKRAYRDTIRSVDRFVKQLSRELDREHLCIFHSDHGEAFNEHGTYGHQQELYEENIHIPLLAYDSTDERAVRVKKPFTLRNLPELLIERVAEGVALAESDLSSSYAISRTESGNKMAVHTLRHKYIYDQSDEEMLYDLHVDPKEMKNLAFEEPEMCETYRSIVKEQWDSLATMNELEADDISRSVQKDLESLGYR